MGLIYQQYVRQKTSLVALQLTFLVLSIKVLKFPVSAEPSGTFTANSQLAIFDGNFSDYAGAT